MNESNTTNSLEFIQKLLSQLHTRIPPVPGRNHCIIVTETGRIQLTLMISSPLNIYIDPKEDGSLTLTQLINEIASALPEETEK